MTARSTGFQRPSCLQQSLKFLQPNLSPFLPAVNAPESTAVCPLLPRCRHHHHHHTGGGPQSLGPMNKDGPVLQVEPHIPQTLWPLVPAQTHSPWLHPGSGVPAAPRRVGARCKYTWWALACLPLSSAARTWLPHLCSDPLPISLPIPATPWGERTAGPSQRLWLPKAQEAGRRSIH